MPLTRDPDRQTRRQTSDAGEAFMTSPQTAPAVDPGKPPITMFGPDFPFAYDDSVKHPAGLGKVPAKRHGTEVAIIGAGIAGLLTAFELMKLGLKPVVYEAGRLGGRLRSVPFEGAEGVIAELGAMRFPVSSTTFYHYLGLAGLETRPFPNPRSEERRVGKERRW